MTKRIAIIMGSTSDLPVMSQAAQYLDAIEIDYDITVVSAHRTPDRLYQFAKSAQQNGYQVIIAGAGGAAHLPGMVASMTPLPVIGVPIKSSNSIDGWDSVLSILQMPNGVPVATVALNGAKNAGILASQILALSDSKVDAKIKIFRQNQTQKVLDQVEVLEKQKCEDPKAL